MVFLEIVLIFFIIGFVITLGNEIFYKIFFNPNAMDIVFNIAIFLGILYWIILVFTDILLLQVILFPFGMFLFAGVIGKTFS